MKKNILIICWGNIYRSVLAEELLRKILSEREGGPRYHIESRGIQGTMGVPAPEHKNLRGYPETYRYTSEALETYAIAIPGTKASTPVSRQDAERADLILVLGNDAHHKLQAEWKNEPDLLAKIHLLSEVKDPHGDKDKQHLQKVVQQIVADVKEFAEKDL